MAQVGGPSAIRKPSLGKARPESEFQAPYVLLDLRQFPTVSTTGVLPVFPGTSGVRGRCRAGTARDGDHCDDHDDHDDLTCHTCVDDDNDDDFIVARDVVREFVKMHLERHSQL